MLPAETKTPRSLTESKMVVAIGEKIEAQSL